MSAFQIISINKTLGTMVINWGAEGTLNHLIPSELYVADAPIEQVTAAIEAMRPENRAVSELANGLNTLFLAHNPPPTFGQLKEQKVVQIDAWRATAEQKGLLYTFPTGENDYIQLRNERDVGNVNGQVSAALILQAQNVTGPVLPFRAESNTTYMLTPAQVLAMGMAVNQFVGQGYQIAWSLKEQAEAATTQDQLDAIIWPE